MLRNLLRWRLALLPIALVLVPCLASCGVEPFAGRPRVWIDVPRDGAEVSVDTPVDVISHAYAREGVAEIMLTVNGDPYTREPPLEPGSPFTQITQQWYPPEPGTFVLQVRAYDTEGQMSNAATVRVTVLGELPGFILTPVEIPTDTPTSTGVPTDTPTSTGVPTDTPTGTGTPTDTPTSTPTGTATTPPPPTIVSFVAQPGTIDLGQCSRLSWAVEGLISSVWLDGEGVGDHDFRDRCPTSTTVYTLRAVGPGGEATGTVRVEVRQPPQDTQGPVISGISASADPIWWPAYPQCAPDQVTISASISDESGVSHATLTYRVVRGGVQGAWRDLPMNQVQTGTYAATITGSHLESSLDPPVYSTATLQYYIRAWDTRNNMSGSGTLGITLKACLI